MRNPTKTQDVQYTANSLIIVACRNASKRKKKMFLFITSGRISKTLEAKISLNSYSKNLPLT